MIDQNINGDAKSKKQRERRRNAPKSDRDREEGYDEGDIIFFDRYLIKKRFNKGSFGQVFKAVDMKQPSR